MGSAGSAIDSESLLLTLRLAALTTALLLLVAVPLAGWIVLGRSRLRVLVEALVALPLMLPPTVLGFYLLVGLGPTTAVGRAVIALTGHTVAFTFTGLLLGSMVYSLPFAVQPLVAGLRGLDPAYLETAAVLGMSPRRSFVRVAMPLIRGSSLAALVLTFTHTIGEFGVVLMLGGNIPGKTRTISIALYDLVEDGRFHEAGITALLLLLFSTGALLLLYTRVGQTRKAPHA